MLLSIYILTDTSAAQKRVWLRYCSARSHTVASKARSGGPSSTFAPSRKEVRMKKIIRAWKDPAYRATLSAAEQAELDNPAGMIELAGTDLELVGGGGSSGSGKS